MKAIIFDVDDVLIDASVSRTVKYKLVFDELNLEFNDSVKNLIESKNYSGVNWVVSHLDYSDDIKSKILKKYGDGTKVPLEFYPMVPGTSENIKRLSEKYTLIAYSAAALDITTEKLTYNNIHNYFTKLFCSNTGDSNQKENNIKQAIEFLNSQGINNNEISIVDDRIQAGIVLGKKYGIHRIRFNFGVHSTNEYVPDKIINSLSELE